MRTCPLLLVVCTLLSLLVALGLVGCGGSGTQAPRPTGTVSLTVHWPAATKMIPTSSLSIKAELHAVRDDGQALATAILNRPPGGGTAATSFEAPEGKCYIVATAHPEADGEGVAQARGRSANLTVVVNETIPCQIHLAGTVRTLTIDQYELNLAGSGDWAQATVTALDANSNPVLLSASAAHWWVDDESVATVSADGRVTAAGPGTTLLHFEDLEQGVAATRAIQVSVGGAK